MIGLRPIAATRATIAGSSWCMSGSPPAIETPSTLRSRAKTSRSACTASIDLCSFTFFR
jgi:hypothetical protein